MWDDTQQVAQTLFTMEEKKQNLTKAAEAITGTATLPEKWRAGKSESCQGEGLLRIITLKPGSGGSRL